MIISIFIYPGQLLDNKQWVLTPSPLMNSVSIWVKERLMVMAQHKALAKAADLYWERGGNVKYRENKGLERENHLASFARSYYGPWIRGRCWCLSFIIQLQLLDSMSRRLFWIQPFQTLPHNMSDVHCAQKRNCDKILLNKTSQELRELSIAIWCKYFWIWGWLSFSRGFL